MDSITELICPHCNDDYLELVRGLEPYSVDYFQCCGCDSTYTFETLKEMDLYDEVLI